MTISVALCTYNGAAYLEDQLVSILNQTEQPGEIIVSDDASTDATLIILENVFASWREHHTATPVLKVIRNAGSLGVTANFEQALAACSGELIALSDQDDVWPPERLKRMAAEFGHNPGLNLLHTDARLVDGTGQPLGLTLFQALGVSLGDRSAVHAGRAVDVFLRRNIVTGATMMIRRELVARSRPFPASWVHDEWLAVVASSTGGVDLLDEPLTDYRQHDSNQIGVTNLDVGGKLGRLRAPRTARNERLLARATVLEQRAASFIPTPTTSTLDAIEAKLAHEQRRSSLAGVRSLRLVPVMRSWLSGDYFRFGLGLQDVLRDLVQPV